VVSLATGDLLQWHVHLHILMTDGAFSDDVTFHPLATWDAEALMRLFRERLLARLIEKHAMRRSSMPTRSRVASAGGSSRSWPTSTTR
jgi:hypothetical protein